MNNTVSEYTTDERGISVYARLKILKKYLPTNCNVLEIGCGGGIVSNLLINRGNKVTGIDYSKDAISLIKNKKLPMNTFVSDIFDFNPNNKYDWIVCAEVLEHITNDKKALRLMKKWLKPNGKIILTVPTSKYIDHIHSKLGHVRHYKTQQLVILCHNVGFSIDKRYEWGSLFRLLALTYFHPRYTARISKSLKSALLKPILTLLVNIDLLLFPFKTELLLVLSKM